MFDRTYNAIFPAAAAALSALSFPLRLDDTGCPKEVIGSSFNVNCILLAGILSSADCVTALSKSPGLSDLVLMQATGTPVCVRLPDDVYDLTVFTWLQVPVAASGGMTIRVRDVRR